MPIAALRASGGVGFSRGVLQSEFLHSLGQELPFPNTDNPADAGLLIDNCRPEVDITVMLSPVSWLIPPCTSGALFVLARLLAAVRILHFGIA